MHMQTQRHTRENRYNLKYLTLGKESESERMEVSINKERQTQTHQYRETYMDRYNLKYLPHCKKKEFRFSVKLLKTIQTKENHADIQTYFWAPNITCE